MVAPLLGLIPGLISAIMPTVDKVVDRTVEDANAAQNLKTSIALGLMENSNEISQKAGDIVLAEARSEHWLTANWRPIIMMIFGTIIANNYILAPYMSAFTGTSVSLEIPPDMWDLLKVGLSGYIVSRGAEKGLKIWRGQDASTKV
jgi:hypothetical protein